MEGKKIEIIILIILLIILGILFYRFLKVKELAKTEKIMSPQTQTLEENTIQEKTLQGKKVAMVIAFRDFRDVEYFVPKDILQSAGADVVVVSNKKGMALGADGGEVEVDYLIDEIDPSDFDAVIFVGGPGCLKNLDNENSYNLIQKTVSQNKLLGAICISPAILAKAKVLEGKKATVWSSPLDKSAIKILEENNAIYENKEVVVDDGIITANGPNAAEEFGKKIVEILTNK
jgi:protease I